jgi:calcium/calmodulin-dependent protein kinase-4
MQDYWIEESIKDRAFGEFYALGKELGKGATSVVYRCQHIGTQQHWAVKIINKKVEKKIIRTEIGVLLRLQHPNIIRLKEIFETKTQIHLVLELVTGGELFDRIVTRGNYSEKDAACCVSEMLQAVKYLHENDVIHRDLKPENLLYEDSREDAHLKLADFGLSKIIDSEVQTQTVCGTPGYCSPEVLKGRKYDTSVDMWSVGVITYILLCGYEPFYSDNEAEMFKKILKCEYTFDSPWWDDISDNAKDLISKLLVLDAKKRLTASEALRHPWVRGKAAQSSHMERTQAKLKQFNAKRKLKAATDVLMAFSFRGFSSLQNRTSSEPSPLQQQQPQQQLDISSTADQLTTSSN